jgi:diguanylate cyclase (GGDEF)-like protein
LALLRAAAPGVATIAVATDPALFAGLQVAACIPTSQLADLGATVRTVLRRAGFPGGRASHLRRRAKAAVEACGTAEQLMARRAALDQALPAGDASAMNSILRRMPPAPAALVLIATESTRTRYTKLLDNANIEVEQAADVPDAIQRLEHRVHAVLFTDSLDLIVQSRRLYSGSATHIVFVDHHGEVTAALAAGANECVPGEARGELFWARLMTVRRIVGLASALQLALTDNKILSTIDELTRCASRRFFENQFPREVARAHRLSRPLALIMVDIDHFKGVNDTHGHSVGDEVLREFADRLSLDLRQREDWVARVGGEEFAVVLPETTEAEALVVAKRLCKHIRENAFVTTAGAIRITASLGVVSRVGALCTVRTAGPFVKQADEALYESKRRGRNRVTVSAVVSAA